jgi:uncharacterized RDD family membrane protein YckC
MSLNALPLASVRSRVFAALIDYGLYFACLIGYIYAFGAPDPEGGYQVTGLRAFPLILLWVLLFPTVEGWLGRTFGKELFGLRVVGASGAGVTFRQAFKRRVIDPFDFGGFGVQALIAAGHTSMRQRLGDLWAETCVVRTESVICPNCESRVTLEGEEVFSGQFRCPECGEDVSVHAN